MREILENQYEKLFNTYQFARPIESQNINSIIRDSLQSFMRQCRKPAIYCNGGHTRMLMADFMCELKNVKYIVDNYMKEHDNCGFRLITDEELEENEIDAVIISSFKFKDDIVERLTKNHPHIKFLNIYDEFAEKGIDLQSDYYYHNHPYHHYHTINTIQRKIDESFDTAELENLYRELITKYLHIKDFRTAIIWAKKLYKIVNIKIYRQLILDLENLYSNEMQAASKIADGNVLMMCIDGLRKQDMHPRYMPKLSDGLCKHAYVFDNAYSFSTSTYESLIPVYSENGDLRTRYYENNFIPKDACRFIKKAEEQNRAIYFYTDMDEFVASEEIRRSGAFQTATEKIWNFLLDALEEGNGLFYIHILYESHFSFSNPYTKNSLISEGTALLFDFLPQKGRKIRTDYVRQHMDSLHYLDDVLTPFLSRLCCRMLLYADHGNLILRRDCKLSEIEEAKLTCAEEWTRIPLVIKSPEMGRGVSYHLMTLMSLNDMVDCLLEKKAYIEPQNEFVKIARSDLYNPNFRYLYKEMKKEKCLQAFEAFVFEEGWKLVIYKDGTKVLFRVVDDEQISNEVLIETLFTKIRDYITVCDISGTGTIEMKT